MKSLVLACAVFACALGGFATLSLTIDRHYEDAFGRGQAPGCSRPWQQAGGAALLVLSLLASLRLQGAVIGWVLWLGALTAAALAVVAVVGYWPARARHVGNAAAALGVGSALLHLLFPR